MQKRKYFSFRSFKYIIHNCRNVKSRKEEKSTLMSSNKFKVLMSKVMNMGISSKGKVRKNKKTNLREEKLKERKKEEKK